MGVLDEDASVPAAGKIVEASADTEVTGVADPGLGPNCARELEVLLDLRLLVVDAKRA